jgi:ankyrin repeat protein
MLNKLTLVEIAAQKTILFQAIDKNDVDAARTAIEKLDVDDLASTTDMYKQTFLHLALRVPTDDIPVLLINKLGSVQLNSADINGDTPLAYAFNSGTDRCIELLMSKLTTEQLLAKQKSGKTYEELALNFGRPVTAVAIKDLRLKTAIQTGKYEEAKTLIEALPVESLYKGDLDGNTALHFFAKQGSTNISTLFLLLAKLPKKALSVSNKNSITPDDAAMISKNHLTASAINTVYGILRPHTEDTSLETLLGIELAKPVFDKLFAKPKEQSSKELS